MFPSLTKAFLFAAILSFGADAVINRRTKHFFVQVSSEEPSIDGSYLVAQKRSPTFGSVLALSDSSATPFYHGYHDGIRLASGKAHPRYAEQTKGSDDGRVYFAGLKYGHAVGGFDNVTCTYGATISKSPRERELLCSSGGRTGLYGCTGDGESSGLFMYNTANPPSGPTTDPEDCFLITGLTALPLSSVPVKSVALVELDD